MEKEEWGQKRKGLEEEDGIRREWRLEEEGGCGKRKNEWEEEERVGRWWDQSRMGFDL